MTRTTTPPALSSEEITRIRDFGARLSELRDEIRQRIVGQDAVVDELFMALLAEGHCLVIGVPGLAKTLLISTLAEILDLTFRRIQFTPDLMPNDITGATIIGQVAETASGAPDSGGGEARRPVRLGSGESGDRGLSFLKGPIFTNLLLADEINRTPPKTQAALMEAMEERQITAHGVRFRLERPFFVLATQNPIEQEGTYPLPVSQLDRFLFTVLIDYPSAAEEHRIMELTTSAYRGEVRRLIGRDELLEMIDLCRRIAVPEKLVEYATRIVRSSRPNAADDSSALAPAEASADDAPARDRGAVDDWVSWGGGPRATQAILGTAKSHAMIHGRSEVNVDDIHRVVFPALRHRLLLSYHGQAEGVDADRVIRGVLRGMPDGLYREAAAPIDSPANDEPTSPWSRATRWLRGIVGS